MGFIKRYPIFCTLLFVFLLVLGGGVYLALGQMKKLDQAKDGYEANLRQIEQVSRGAVYDAETGQRIVPSSENREKLEARLAEVQLDLNKIRNNMVARTENILVPPADEFTFLPKLQSFISRMKSFAKTNEVTLQGDEAFGFAKYAIDAVQPPKDLVPLLDRQRQVLQYILRQLIESKPTAILSVERELVEATPDQNQARGARNENKNDDVFTIEELVTARSNEFINTFAFRIVFTGRTDVLRTFLNKVSQFELPLIVRSVEVRPTSEQDVPKAATPERGSQNSANDIFALFGGNEPEEAEPAAEPVDDSRKPVITENKSRFTVVVEFVEVEIELGVKKEEDA